MNPVNDMIGHNAGTALHQANAAVAGLGLALQDDRTIRADYRAQMIIVARHLLAVDQASAGNEATADGLIKKAGVVQTTDRIAGVNERVLARWLARGGVLSADKDTLFKSVKTPNEINDLKNGLNDLERRVLTEPKFAKLTSYVGINSLFASECKTEIRKALTGDDSEAVLDAIRNQYADLIFKAETVEGWIEQEKYRRSDEYKRLQEIKKAWAIKIEEEIQAARKDPTVRAFGELERHVVSQLKRVREEARKKEAEIEARKKLAELTAEQRRTITETFRRANETGISQDIRDEDF